MQETSALGSHGTHIDYFELVETQDRLSRAFIPSTPRTTCRLWRCGHASVLENITQQQRQ